MSGPTLPTTFEENSVYNVFFDAGANRIISNVLLKIPGRVDPSFNALHINIFNGSNVTEFELSRADVLEQIVLDPSLVSVLVVMPWSQRNVQLSIVYIEKENNGLDYVLHQRYLPNAPATPLSISNNPSPVVLTNNNTQQIVTAPGGLIDINNISLNVQLGSSGGVPFKYYNVYQTITDISGNTTTVSVNTVIPASGISTGNFNIPLIDVTGLLPDAVVSFSVSVDNVDGLESAISNAVSISGSLRPDAPTLITALSAQQAVSPSTVFVPMTVGLNRDQLSSWAYLVIQYSTSLTGTWTNGAYLLNNAALVAQLNQQGFVSINQPDLSAQTGYYFRAVLAQSASPSTPPPADQSLPSNVLQAFTNVNPAPTTTISMQPAYNAPSNSYTFTTTVDSAYNPVALLAQFQLVQNNVVVQTVILSQAASTEVSPPVFTLAASAVQLTDVFSVNLTYFNYLSAGQSAFYVNPSPQILNGTPIIILGSTSSPNMILPPTPSQLPQPANMSLSEIYANGVDSILAEFISPSNPLLQIASVDYQASLASNFSPPLILTYNGLTIKNVPVAFGQVDEAQILTLYTPPGLGPGDAYSLSPNTSYYVQARFNFTYGTATIVGNWSTAQFITAPAPLPAGPTSFGMVRLQGTNILDASWNAAGDVTYNGFTFSPLKYIIGFYDEIGVLVQQNIINYVAGTAIVHSQYNVPSALLDQYFTSRVVTVFSNIASGAQVTSTQSISFPPVNMLIAPVINSVVVTETATTITIVANVDAGRSDANVISVQAFVPFSNNGNDFCANMTFSPSTNLYSTGPLTKIADAAVYENLRVYVSAYNSAGMGYASWP